MPWPVVLFKDVDAARAAGVNGEPPIGAMFPANESNWQASVSANYLRDWKGKRAAMWVLLPCRHWFCIDGAAYDAERGYHGDGWVVTGDPPNVTVTPSINCVGSYHGWLTAGVLTDDCEGRTYPLAGRASAD